MSTSFGFGSGPFYVIDESCWPVVHFNIYHLPEEDEFVAFQQRFKNLFTTAQQKCQQFEMIVDLRPFQVEQSQITVFFNFVKRLIDFMKELRPLSKEHMKQVHVFHESSVVDMGLGLFLSLYTPVVPLEVVKCPKPT